MACRPISPPYIRTVAGALLSRKYTVRYLTIDQLRNEPLRTADLNNAAILVMIAGVTVPGKYLGGTPATLTEIQQVGHMVRAPVKLIGGPIGFGYAKEGGQPAVRQVISGFTALLSGEPAVALDNYLAGNEPAGRLDYSRTDPWSIAGSSVITPAPRLPLRDVRARDRPGLLPRGDRRLLVLHRAVLRDADVPEHRRGGCRSCRTPHPRRPALPRGPAAGYPGLRCGRRGVPRHLNRRSWSSSSPASAPAAPDLKTLHIDNTNPATIARHEDASREALRAIIRHHTPGDVAAFGMETADPAVVAANNLKANADEVFRAIEIVNEEGGKRRGQCA